MIQFSDAYIIRAPLGHEYVTTTWWINARGNCDGYCFPKMCTYVNTVGSTYDTVQYITVLQTRQWQLKAKRMAATKTSSNENIFRVPGPLCGEFTGHRWISLTKASDAELWCFLWCAPEQTPEQTIETPVMRDVMALIMTSVLWFGRQTIHTSSHPLDDFFYGISVKIILLKTDTFIKPHFISKFVIDYFAPMICFLQPNVMAYVRQNIRLCRVEGLL